MSDLVVMAEDAAPNKKVSSHDIKLGIRNSFASGYQTFFEVGNDTGTRVTRHADAVSIGIWPSTGHRIHGFEVKVSRADFANEMKNGDKAEAIFQFCHHWSLATPPGLVRVDELPPNWGLVTFDGRTLRTVKSAPRLAPVAMTPGFVAALVRRAGEADAELIKAAEQKITRDIEGRFKERADRMLTEHRDRRIREAEEAVKLVDRLKADLGESWLSEYSAEGIVAAIKVLRKLGLEGSHIGLANMAETLEKSAARIREGITALGIDAA